jgi:hypothetical protein
VSKSQAERVKKVHELRLNSVLAAPETRDAKCEIDTVHLCRASREKHLPCI